MNAVEIEQAISDLAELEFDAAEFPFAFLEAFGNKATTLKKLRSGSSNKSDLGGVLQTGNIHIKVAEPGQVTEDLAALRDSPATLNKRHRVKFILATDGDTLEAEDLASGETVACAILISRTSSASSSHWLGSRQSSRSGKTHSMSGQHLGSIAFM